MTTQESNKWTIFGSVGAAIAAAICCLGPLLLVSLGVTGAWIGNLSALEPYRPIFVVVAAAFLGSGFYRVYGRSSTRDCHADGQECEVPASHTMNVASLWIATFVVLALLMIPYFPLPSEGASGDAASPGAADEAAARASSTVTLQIEEMTCSGCASTVDTALRRVPGVLETDVTFEPPRAHVTYAPGKTTTESLTRATTSVGYPSHPIEEPR